MNGTTAAVGRAISDARKRRGMTQGALAAELGVSRPALSNMEAGRQDVGVARLARIARLLGGAIWDDGALRIAFAVDDDRAPAAATERAVGAVLRERSRQDARWGRQRHRWAEWMAILGEEVGEACQAANGLTRHDAGAGQAGIEGRAALRAELVQVAAVAAAIVEHLDEDLSILFAEIGTGDDGPGAEEEDEDEG